MYAKICQESSMHMCLGVSLCDGKVGKLLVVLIHKIVL